MIRARAVFLAAFPLCAASALAGETDWKYYSSSVVQKDASALLFFDKHGLKQLAYGHVEVWIKGLRESEVEQALQDDVASKKNVIVEAAARKVASYYPLPYGIFGDLDQETYVNLVTAEEVANQAEVQPIVRILYDIDCRGQMIRELTITQFDAGKVVSSSDKPRDWQRIAPETPAHNLLELTCGLR